MDNRIVTRNEGLKKYEEGKQSESYYFKTSSNGSTKIWFFCARTRENIVARNCEKQQEENDEKGIGEKGCR